MDRSKVDMQFQITQSCSIFRHAQHDSGKSLYDYLLGHTVAGKGVWKMPTVSTARVEHVAQAHRAPSRAS